MTTNSNIPPLPGGKLPTSHLSQSTHTHTLPYYNSTEHIHDADKAAQRLQLTIAYKTRTITIDTGPDPIVAQILPEIARRLGALDTTIVHGGYHLVTEDGFELLPDRSFKEQNVENHSILTLHPGVLDDNEIVYDDVVEAVGDSVNRIYTAWTSEQTTLTSLIISTGTLLIGAALLAFLSPTIINATLGIGFAIILLVLAITLHSKDLIIQSSTISLVSSLFAFIGCYQMVVVFIPQSFFQGTALLAGCGGSILIGLSISLLFSKCRPYSFIPISIGIILAIPALFSIIFPSFTAQVWIGYTAVVAVAMNMLPWAALSLSRLSVHSPQSESEIFELPPAIDIQDIKQRYINGSSILFIGRITAATLLVVTTPLLAAQPAAFAGVMILIAFVNMLIGSRQIYTLREMIVTVAASAIGLVLTCTVFIHSHPQFGAALTIGLICCALLTVCFTYITRTQSLFATRVADAAEIVCLVAILPLAYLAITV